MKRTFSTSPLINIPTVAGQQKSMNRLNNGNKYRATVNGYVIERGKRTVHIIAKTPNAGEKARDMIANMSFNKMFNKGKKMAITGHNLSYIKL